MSNIFANIDADVEVQEAVDFDGKRTKDTGVYDAVIKLCYLSLAGTGSTMLNTVYKIGNSEVSLKAEYLYKDPKVQYYIDKKTGAKKQNIGIAKLNELHTVATGVPLKDATIEDKVIKVWDYDLKKEAPVKRQVITSLTGAKVKLALQEIRENKYSDPTQEAFLNEVVKVLHADTGATLAEKNAGKDATWADNWEAKNKGVLKDNFKAPEPTEGAEVDFEDDAEGEDIFG